MTTAAQLEAALRSVGGLGGQAWPLSQLAKEADEAMRSSGVTTRQGAAAFIAQCMIESAYFRTTSEYKGSQARYAPHYGRGFIQVTFRDNYAKFGRWAKGKGLVSDANYFVNNPSKLAEAKWKWLTAVWYLSTHHHDLIKLGNEGKIDAVGKGVHAGDAHASWYPSQANTEQGRIQRNRFKHNRAAYNALLNAGVQAPGKSSSSSFYTPPKGVKMTVKQIQKAVGVTADGKYGNATSLAVREYQKQIGIRGKAVDGKWGEATEAAYIAAGKPKPKKAAAPKPATTPRPTVKKPKLAVDGKLGSATYKALQREVGARPVDGVFGVGSKKATQRWLRVTADGVFGRKSIRALQKKVGAKQDGVWGSGTTKALQTWLNKNG